MKIAYCVAYVDTTQRPPVITECGIYSESAKSLTGAIHSQQWAFDVAMHTAPDFEQAKRELLEYMRYDELHHGWALRLLDEASRG